MQAEHPIEPTYVMIITFPTTVTIQQKAGCTVVGANVGTGYSCNADGATNAITITNMFSTQQAAMTQEIFTVNSIRNPSNFVTVGAVTITIQTPTGGKIDEGSYTVSTTFKKSYIQHSETSNGFTVEALDLTAGKYPVTYRFSVTPKAKVVKDSYLVVQFPDDIVPYDKVLMARACGLLTNFTGFTAASIACSYDSNTNQFRIDQGLNNMDSIHDPPTFTWQLNYMTNPRGISTSGMFNVTIYNSANKALFINYIDCPWGSINYLNCTQYGPNVTMLYAAIP
jgi:hypothetical protein